MVCAAWQVAVYAVIGGVELAVFVPFDGGVGRVGAAEIGVFDDGGLFDPVDAFGLYGPEDVGLVDGAVIHGLVFLGRDVGVVGDVGRWCMCFHRGNFRRDSGRGASLYIGGFL